MDLQIAPKDVRCQPTFFLRFKAFHSFRLSNVHVQKAVIFVSDKALVLLTSDVLMFLLKRLLKGPSQVLLVALKLSYYVGYQIYKLTKQSNEYVKVILKSD